METEAKIPFLSGCVLYLLLRKATLPDASPRMHRQGVKDEHKNPEFMADLVYTFTGIHMPKAGSDTSRYREGKNEGTANVPFNDGTIISIYDENVREDYPTVLRRMCEFADWHLNPEMMKWFVKACLDIIEKDEDIKDSDAFCVESDGSFVTKAELENKDEFDFQPFILGVLHYILLNRAGKNAMGIPTLDAIGDKKPSKERRYCGHLGEGITRKIEVQWYVKPAAEEPEAVSEDTKDPATDDSRSDDQVITDNLIYGLSIFASGVERQKHQIAEEIRRNSERQEEKTAADDDQKEGPDPEPDKAKSRTTIIQHQTNVVQKGDHNVNMTNNGNITLNL